MKQRWAPALANGSIQAGALSYCAGIDCALVPWRDACFDENHIAWQPLDGKLGNAHGICQTTFPHRVFW